LNDVAPERRDYLALGLLLVVAAALRLPGVWQFDLWQDEIYSIYEARELFWSTIGPGGMELRPLYFLLLHPIADALPRSHELLRLPAFLFGLLGVAAIWRLTWGLFGRGAALLTTTLTVMLPLHITESQSIRYWSFIFLLGALFSGALLRALRSEEPRQYTRALAWLLIASFTHPTFLVSAAGLALGAHLIRGDGTPGLMLPTRLAWRRLWLPFLGVLGAYYTALTFFFPIKRMVGESVGSVARLLPAVGVALTPAVGAASLYALYRLLRGGSPTERRLAMMVIVGMSVPVAVLAVGRSLEALPISILYLFATFPVVLAAVGSLVPALAGEGGSQGRVTAALLVVLGASMLPSTISHLRDGTRFDYRPALRHIMSQDPRGAVVIWPLIEATWHAPELEGIELRPGTTAATFDSLAAARDRFWVVLSRRRYGVITDPDLAKSRWVERHCDRVHTQEALRLDWEVYSVSLFRCGDSAP
jgi:hypothetical protein